MAAEQHSPELVEQTLDLANQVFRELLPIIPREVLDFDLTMPQLKVVLLLYLNGAMRMSDIASALGVSLATATGIADRLVERDLVLRDAHPSDRRVVLCRLSDQGEDLTGVLWRSARQNARELLMTVSEDRLLMLKEALQALLDAGTATGGDKAGTKHREAK